MCVYGDRILIVDLNGNKILSVDKNNYEKIEETPILDDFTFDKPDCICTDGDGNVFVGQVRCNFFEGRGYEVFFCGGGGTKNFRKIWQVRKIFKRFWGVRKILRFSEKSSYLLALIKNGRPLRRLQLLSGIAQTDAQRCFEVANFILNRGSRLPNFRLKCRKISEMR